MEMEQVDRSAKTVEEAVEMALKELDANREEAEIEVLSQGKQGFLGHRLRACPCKGKEASTFGTCSFHSHGGGEQAAVHRRGASPWRPSG